jgi:predicted O-linked N-acetylglucosamine transferase (SPINDLY family)
LGITLQDLGRLEEAEASYRQAISLKPDYAEAHSNLGITLRVLGRLDEAEASYRKAIALKPDFAEAHSNLGGTLRELGRSKDAEASYRQAISLKPDYAEAHSNLLFLQSSCAFDSALHLKEALNYANAISKKISSRFAEWSCVKKPQRLRIGFVSGDFKNHPVGYFLEGLLTQLNPSSVELFAYPTHFIEDELTTRIKPCFASWTPLFNKGDKEAARLIHNDGIHILIDLSGHTANNRLPIFAWKPAPIQISWLGYWATTGVPEIDYVLGDPHVTPPRDDDHFTEKVWRLPETRWCFTPPDVDVEVSAPPALKQDYVTFGCFSNLTKINDKVVELWAKVLDAIPDSRLLLKAKQLRDQLVRESIIQRFAAQGINGKRISLEESEDRQKYFAAYNRIDITLDPFPFTGGTVSVESLWMGVPLITLAGDSLISRQGVGVLINAGLPDWVAGDEESYLAKAIIFASDLDKLARLRANLRSQALASPLFDAPRFAQNFENALFEMWNQYAHQSRKKYP